MREMILREGRIVRGFEDWGLGQALPLVPVLPGTQNLALPGAFQGTSAQNNWNQIQTQLQAEGAAAGATPLQIANSLATAQGQYLNTLNSFITSGITKQNPNLANLAQAAQDATLATSSVVGAVNAVNGIAAGISSDNWQEVQSGVQALLGIISSISLTLGFTGVGAVIGAVGVVIVLTFEILEQAGILPSLPPGSVNVGDGHCSNFGFIDPESPTPVGGTIPANLKVNLASPGANGEGICAWGSLIKPGSENWRTFPDPKNTWDAQVWYTPVTEASWLWPADTSGGPLPNSANWYTKNSGNWRPIDNAFHVYRTMECEALLNYELSDGAGPGHSTALTSVGFLRGAAIVAFLQSYFFMWKKNAEFALNGLTPAPDQTVLEQLVAVWNAAHAPGDGLDIYPTTSQIGTEGDCSQQTTTYVSMLVGDLVNGAGSPALVPAMDGSGTMVVHINTGDQLTPPNTVTTGAFAGSTNAGGTGPVTPPAAVSGTSAGTVAVGALAVGALGVGGLYAYAAANGLTMMEALRRIVR